MSLFLDQTRCKKITFVFGSNRRQKKITKPCSGLLVASPPGSGTKYESVLVKALNDEAFKALGRANLTGLTQGFRMAADAVVRNLDCQARKITTFEEIAQVGTTAANGDGEIGELIAKVFEKGWENDLITIFDRKALYNELNFVKGMKLEWGLKSPYFFTHKNKKECVLDGALVLIYDTKISNSNVIRQASLPCMMQGQSLLVVAEDVENEVLGDIATDFTCTTEKVCIIKAAGLAEDRKAIMEDLAILTGGQVLTGGSGMNSTYFVPLKLGSCKRVIATMDNVVIIGGSGELVDIQERCEQLRSTIKLSTSDKLKDRLAKLSGGYAVLKVCGHGKAEVREKKLKITNALHAVQAAKEEGIVPGSGVALLYALKELDKLQTTNSDQKIGVQIVQNALKVSIPLIIISFSISSCEPEIMAAYLIASNAGVDGSVIDKLLEQDSSDLGYNPARGNFVDMFKCGDVDPLKHVPSEFAKATSPWWLEHVKDETEAPGRLNDRNGFVEDLAILTRGQFTLSPKITVRGGSGDWTDIHSEIHIENTLYELEMCWDLESRIQQLSRSAAILKDRSEGKKDRVEKAVRLYSSAMKNGVLPGDGVALLYSSKELDNLQTTNSHEKIGIQLLQNALR
ncbi:60 kDa chaperonin [Citrus sinensis]|nr:60 kDa chaperonin [Citrus sinensis]